MLPSQTLRWKRHCRVREQPPVDMLQVQRLKKRKLSLKDQITRLESRLLPDIIA
jgi:hypothetical protein